MSKGVLKKDQAQFLSFSLEKFSGSHEENTINTQEQNPNLSPSIKEDLEEQKKKAYDEGFAKGYEDGKRHGFDEGFKEGLAQGRERGYEEGKEEAKSEIEALEKDLLAEYNAKINILKDLIENLNEETKRLVLDLDKDILALAMTLTETILFNKPVINEEGLLRLIRRCLEFVAEGLKVKVRIHPEDLNLINKHLDKLPATYLLDFEEDPDLTRGGIILSSPTGIIDATMETRIRQIFSRLKDEG